MGNMNPHHNGISAFENRAAEVVGRLPLHEHPELQFGPHLKCLLEVALTEACP